MVGKDYYRNFALFFVISEIIVLLLVGAFNPSLKNAIVLTIFNVLVFVVGGIIGYHLLKRMTTKGIANFAKNLRSSYVLVLGVVFVLLSTFLPVPLYALGAALIVTGIFFCMRRRYAQNRAVQKEMDELKFARLFPIMLSAEGLMPFMVDISHKLLLFSPFAYVMLTFAYSAILSIILSAISRHEQHTS